MGVDFHAQLVVGIPFESGLLFSKGKAIKKCRDHGAKPSGSHCIECGNRLEDGHEEIPTPTMLHACKVAGLSTEDIMDSFRDRWGETFKLGLFAVDCDSPPIVLGEEVASSDSHRSGTPVTTISFEKAEIIRERVRQNLIKLFSIRKEPELFVIGYVSY